jgi:hypothetical protein
MRTDNEIKLPMLRDSDLNTKKYANPPTSAIITEVEMIVFLSQFIITLHQGKNGRLVSQEKIVLDANNIL